MVCSLTAAAILLGSAAAADLTVTVDGAPLPGAHILENGTTYVPLVPLLEELNAGPARWDSASRTVQAETEHFNLSVPAGENYVLADGAVYGLAAPTLIRAGRTYIPLRTFANLFGAEVLWDGGSRSVTISTGQRATSYTEEDLYWLSRVISAESRGESLWGQIAVGNVVLNRVASDDFPDTIKGVVFDRKNAVQFEPVANGTIYNEPTAHSILAARLVLSGTVAVQGCLYFFNPSLSQGTWIRENRTYRTTIGCHMFYD